MPTILELHVSDFEKVKEFYSTLGFKTIWERMPEKDKGYLVMQWEDNILCFWCGTKDVMQHSYFRNFPPETKNGYGVEIILTTKDLNALYDRIKESECVVEPLKKKPWGLMDFRVKDPYGFYLRITSPHDILSPEWAIPELIHGHSLRGA